MPPKPAQVLVHPSQFPDAIQAALVQSLRTRKLNHKFLYDSLRQTRKWLELHEACSPARNDPDCLAIYDRAFETVSGLVRDPAIHLVGLGCGGGQKDVRLLELFQGPARVLSYTPCDVSSAMVLVARSAALRLTGTCQPLVCDLALTPDLQEMVNQLSPLGATRIITFFGMIPNFEPDIILPRLADCLRETDLLLFSANLAPGSDYAAGVRRILPLYDNRLTREWLMLFLSDLGIGPGHGSLQFSIDASSFGLQRVVANFQFSQPAQVRLGAETFEFATGENFRVFFSYRYTPALVQQTLAQFGLEVSDEWVARSEEEGVFLVRKKT